MAITIIGDSALLSELYEHVKQYIYEPQAKNCVFSGQGNLKVILDEDSAGYKYLLEMSDKHQLHPHISQWTSYTKSEQDQAEYFQMYLPFPLEIEGTDAADYGTQYKGGCLNLKCQLGKKLTGNVLIDRKFMKKWDIGNLRPDIYVSEKLKELICSNGLTGVSFEHEVKDFKGREMPKFYVMDIKHTLPPMATSTWLIQDEYPHQWYKECGHQVVYLRSDIQYEEEKMDRSFDFNLSAEYIDNFRLQEIIVSVKVRNLFRQHKVYARFFPVAIIK